MEIAVLNINGKDTGKKVVLNDSVFGIEPNDHAIYLAVKQFMANHRQGTHSSKERSVLSGSTRKIKRQKGTGSARAGDIKSPLFRGGARVFGPHPRDYHFKLNKKLKKLARLSALSYKAKNEAIYVLEDFNFEVPKTKKMVELLNNLKVSDEKTLLVLNDLNKNVYLSTRNLAGVKIISVSDLNTYDILDAKKMLITESSINAFEQLL